MEYPSFLGAPLTVNRLHVPGALNSDRLTVPHFSLDTQRFDNWCWAAVTQAVERHKGNQVQQVQIASDHIGRGQPGRSCAEFDPQDTTAGSCIVSACQSRCNATHSLRTILDERGLLVKFVANTLGYHEIKAEIANGRPVPCRIAWNDGGGAHFVCVAGCFDDGGSEQFVVVYDPLNPDVDAGPADRLEVRYEDFCLRFRSGASEGAVSHVYFVR